jgi:hypothetical protein
MSICQVSFSESNDYVVGDCLGNIPRQRSRNGRYLLMKLAVAAFRFWY